MKKGWKWILAMLTAVCATFAAACNHNEEGAGDDSGTNVETPSTGENTGDGTGENENNGDGGTGDTDADNVGDNNGDDNNNDENDNNGDNDGNNENEENNGDDDEGTNIVKPGADTQGNVFFTGADERAVKKYADNVTVEKVSAPVNGMKITTVNDWSRVDITLTKDGAPLTEADLSEYRYIEINVYAEQAGTRLFFLSQPLTALQQGENKIKLSTWDMLYQLKQSGDAYDFETGAGYFQIWEGGHTVVFGEMVGVIDPKEEVPSGSVGEATSADILNDCERAVNGAFEVAHITAETSALHAIEGDCSIKVVADASTYTGESAYQYGTALIYLKKNGVPLTRAQIAAYDYIELNVYAESVGTVITFYNHVVGELSIGENVLRISSEDFLAQVDGGNKGTIFEPYDYASGYAYFQVAQYKGTSNTLYFDNIRGVSEGVVEFGNVFILGDSYSTFEEYIPYGSDAAWYRQTPAFVTDVDKATETWWWQLLQETNSNLLLNASFSGTTMCNTGYDGVLGGAKGTSFTTRLQEYIDAGYFEENKVDTFFLFGGTNDIWSNADNKYDIGQPKYTDWEETDLNYLLPAFCYLIYQIKTGVNPTKLVFILNDELVSHDKVAVEKYKEICAYYGVEVVELAAISKQSGHPDEAGMTSIKNQIIQHFKK